MRIVPPLENLALQAKQTEQKARALLRAALVVDQNHCQDEAFDRRLHNPLTVEAKALPQKRLINETEFFTDENLDDDGLLWMRCTHISTDNCLPVPSNSLKVRVAPKAPLNPPRTKFSPSEDENDAMDIGILTSSMFFFKNTKKMICVRRATVFVRSLRELSSAHWENIIATAREHLLKAKTSQSYKSSRFRAMSGASTLVEEEEEEEDLDGDFVMVMG
ncbi:hypothetical protein AX15_005597 [Amanita polypyramis BW_CC]|nr:hypothetical protein AX15_005597 [Amanita polypyramis BW_CC]